MNAEKIEANVEKALNPSSFDVLSYLEGASVATDEVTIYTDVAGARKLSKLMKLRTEELNKRKTPGNEDLEELSITSLSSDTDYDDEINELIEELEKTALTFRLKTVAPELKNSIEKHYLATASQHTTPEAQAEHGQRRVADILYRAIDSVVNGEGQVDNSEWSIEKLLELETRLYDTQATRLIGALHEIVYTGHVFEEALNVDF